MTDQTTSSIQVLHVDDDAGFAGVVAKFLELTGGIEVTTATNVADGLAILETADVDCVISDYDMPGQDGLSFLRSVRDQYDDLPFVLFTAEGSEDVAAEAIEAGVTDYVRKRGVADQYEVIAKRLENYVQKHRNDRAIAAERERHTALFGNTSDAVAYWEWVDGQPIVRQVNPAFEELFGYDERTAVGRSLDSLVVPKEDVEEAKRINDRALSGELVELEVTRKAADGERRFVLHSVPIDPDADTIATGYAVYRDVTELRQQERRYRTLLDESSDITAVLDPDGTIEYVSPSLEYVLGYEESEMLGRDVFELVHPNDVDGIAMEFERLVADPDATPQVEFRYRRADGTWIHLEARGRNLLSDPLVGGVVVYVRDITERRERDETIQKYRTVLDTTSDAAFVLDGEGRIEFVNQAIVEQTGLSTMELLGESLSLLAEREFLTGQEYENFVEAVEELVDGEREELRTRLEIDLQGESRWFEVVLTRLHDDGDTIGIVGISREVTDRVAYERVLERQNHRLEQFASVVSHDIRNPIEVARGALTDYRKSGDPASADRIDESLDRMDAIVDDVLTLAREGQRVGDVTLVSLEVIARRAWSSVNGDGRLQIDTGGLIRADPDRLQRALENLFGNALEHGSRNGEAVTITVRTIDGGFVVDDDGRGFDGDEHDRVFDVGYSSNTDGTGLGLNIVKTIVEAHGWTIHIGTSPDGGARITVDGPRVVERSPTREESGRQ